MFETQLSAHLRVVRSATADRHLIRFIEDKEAVHPFPFPHLSTSESSKLRIGGSLGRLCFALLHPFLPMEPLCFVQLALVWNRQAAQATPSAAPKSAVAGLEPEAPLVWSKNDPTTSVQAVLTRNTWVDAPSAADLSFGPQTALLYTITNAYPAALKGLQLASHLLFLVLAWMQRRYPRLQQVLTLSPMPSFRRWLDLKLGIRRSSMDKRQALKMFGDGPESIICTYSSSVRIPQSRRASRSDARELELCKARALLQALSKEEMKSKASSAMP